MLSNPLLFEPIVRAGSGADGGVFVIGELGQHPARQVGPLSDRQADEDPVVSVLCRCLENVLELYSGGRCCSGDGLRRLASRGVEGLAAT